ncbi:Uncharacterized protein TCAP_05463 [Tolypocladium capitatum]|uniref:3'-5' exonuclease domain-containing protein n=1 Tax=Tolypocladium capitatum TaxID=45235 RepID=A0A2K3QAQ0_9HYPO|nr:Uncharacterized protein TCAP_05463 [Tolypocladium capitatum]
MEASKATTAEWIDQPAQLANFIDYIGALPPHYTLLYLDVQGDNLGTHGAVSVLSVSLCKDPRVFLIDVLTLGAKAFSTPGTQTGRTMKYILESREIEKAFFDVRSDAHALYHNYGIRLGGVQDLQVMEVVIRKSSDKRSLRSFADIMLGDIGLDSIEEVEKFNKTMQRRKKLIAVEGAGAREMFNQRPLSEDAMTYCIFDVKFLHLMRFCFNDRLSRGKDMAIMLSEEWVKQGQAADFTGRGEHMALAPPGL